MYNPFRIYALLCRLAHSAIPSQPDPLVYEGEGCTPSGTEFDIYQHYHKNLAVWILVHGVTLNGRRDQRLIHFARTLAHFGNICIVPTLQGLASCRWELRDPDELAQIVALVSQKYQQPLGLIGVSFGGSYALLVANRLHLSEHIQHVITFSAYHDLEYVFQDYITGLKKEPQSDDEWNDAIYRQLVFLYGQPDRFGFSPNVWLQMESLLRRYCWEAPLAEKRRFYSQYVQHLKLSEIVKRSLQPGVLKRLSPAGKVNRITCAVTLIHDRHDQLIPPVHSERIFLELQTLPGNQQYQLVLTSLLSHVSASHLLNIPDILRFARALSPLV